MKDSKEILSSVIQTAQMGQIGIRSVLNSPLRASLKDALRAQLQEFNSIEQEALVLAASRGWSLKQLDPAVKHMTNMMCKAKLSFGDASSRAAAMMIQGNTKGVIKGYKNLNQAAVADERVRILCQKLLDSEQASISQLQGFL